MSARLEFARELGVVVDLAVEDDCDGASLVVDRLVAGHEIDDAQPAVSQRHAFPEVGAVGIRPSVTQNVRHPAEKLTVHRMTRVGEREAGDSAHGCRSPRERYPPT